MMPYVQATKSFRHSEAIPRAALYRENTSTQVDLILPTILDLSPSRNFSSAQDNFDNISFLISAFIYTAVTDHPDLHR